MASAGKAAIISVELAKAAMENTLDGLGLIDIYLNFIGIGIWIAIGALISTKLFVWKEVAG